MRIELSYITRGERYSDENTPEHIRKEFISKFSEASLYELVLRGKPGAGIAHFEVDIDEPSLRLRAGAVTLEDPQELRLLAHNLEVLAERMENAL